MSGAEKYQPGPAHGVTLEKKGESWTLVLVRDLAHPPEKVWRALTDPDEIREWAPFDADRNLGSVGTATLTTVGSPTPHVTPAQIKRADPPRSLEFTWGGQDIRWQLEPSAKGTRLTLWHNIDRNFIAMGAAGWHLCIDVMDRFIDGHPIGRIVGPDALKFDGWHRLHEEYAKQFGVEVKKW